LDQMLGFWELGHEYGIARGDSPCELPPPCLASKEGTLREEHPQRWHVL